MFVPIIGTESELGNQGLNIDSFTRLLHERASKRGRLPGVSLAQNFYGLNGCRLYQDCHQGMEYATPECRSPQEALAYEMAGPLLLNRLAVEVYGSGMPENIWALKNNNPPIAEGSVESDFSYGNHINIQMPLKVFDGGGELRHNINDYAATTAALIATLPLLCGAGSLVRHSGAARLGGFGYSYRISARSHYTGCVVSSMATSSRAKPMILSRDEPLGHTRKYWRLQVTGLDANILPAANLVKLTALQVTAEMWAAGVLEPVVLADPVAALRQLSGNWQARLDVLGGSPLTAVDIQYRYLRQAVRYVTRNNRTIYAPGIREWMRQLDAFRSSAEVPTSLFGANDWVTKYLLIQHKHADFDRAQQISLVYHGYRLGRQFESSQPQRLLAKYAPPNFMEQVRRAMVAPPPTRALVRSRFIAAVQDTGAEFDLSWIHLRLSREGKAIRDLKLPDPRSTYVQGLASLIQDTYDLHYVA